MKKAEREKQLAEVEQKQVFQTSQAKKRIIFMSFFV